MVGRQGNGRFGFPQAFILQVIQKQPANPRPPDAVDAAGGDFLNAFLFIIASWRRDSLNQHPRPALLDLLPEPRGGRVLGAQS
jgi:hypothetical protein